MNLHNLFNEDTSGDYQQMQDFVRANRVGGVPQDQQVALALFKELKKQQAQNQELSSELNAAEQRIDQAMTSGELSKRELGMHRAELDRERTAGEKQQAAVGQLGQQYAEREQASAEQMEKLRDQLQQVRNQPGVDPKAAEELEQQIKELGQNSVSADRLAELESSIKAVQNMHTVDDSAIKDLVKQVQAAQATTKELQKTRSDVGKDVEQKATSALDQVAQMRQDIDRLRRIETDLEQELNDLRDNYKETDATLWDIESQTIPSITQQIDQLKTARAVKDVPVPTAPQQQVQTPPAPQQPSPAAKATAQRLINKGVLEPEPMLESAFARSIAWATGKKNMKLDEIQQRLDPNCWKGKHKEGTKIKGGVRVNNCVPNESVAEDDAGDVEQRMTAKIEKEKQRLAKLKQTDPEAYKREIAKRKTSSRIPPVSTFEEQGVAEGLGKDMATLGGIATLGIAGGLAGNYADQQQPKVEIGGKIAFVEPAHSRVPDSAMTLTGKDGKTYRVWTTRGTAESPQRWHAVPVEGVKEGFDDVVKGVKRYVRGKPSKSERETHHANRTIGAAQAFHQTSDPTEKDYIKQQMFKHANRYYKVKDLPKEGVAEGSLTTKNVAPVKAKPLSMERPKGEWDPVHGKAPKRGTVKYDIWRQKVSQDKKGVAEGSDTYRQGHAKYHTKTNKQVGPTHYGRGSDKKADSYTKADPRYHEVRPVKEQGVSEGHADQQRKVFKKNGHPVGEVGIDRESSPGVGQWYMKYYPTGDDFSGYDSMEEAVAELKHLVNQFKAEGVAEGYGLGHGGYSLGYPGGRPVGQAPRPDMRTALRPKGSPEDRLGSAEAKIAKDLAKSKKKERGVAEGWTKLPSGDYQNSHTGVRSSKPPVKKKRGEKTGAEWDAIKAKKEEDQLKRARMNRGYFEDQGVAESHDMCHVCGQTPCNCTHVVEEMYEAMDQLAHEMAQRNGASPDLVWEQFEALPDSVLYETAAWRRKEGKSKSGGLNAKGVASYRREHPGSKLQTAVTTKPSKLKKGSKAAKRRKSFCARMSGVKGPMKKPNGKPTRKALALRKWNC